MADARRSPPATRRRLLGRQAIEALRVLCLSALLAIGLISLLAALDLAAPR